MDYTYDTTTPTDVTSSSDSAYNAGKLLAPVIFVGIIYLIGYWGLRLIKKRKPTKREKIIILVVAIGLSILSIIGRALSSSIDAQY